MNKITSLSLDIAIVRMSTATSQLAAKMAELRHNRTNADVTINCEGNVIMVHSLILDMRYVNLLLFADICTGDKKSCTPLRSEYFKTALNTEVGGGWKRVITVEECSHLVLSAIVDFMYGINIPEDINMEDMFSLLAMADLYLMEDLKVAVAPLLSKQLTTKNILYTSRMAEKYNALRLKEVCCDFILEKLTGRKYVGRPLQSNAGGGEGLPAEAEGPAPWR